MGNGVGVGVRGVIGDGMVKRKRQLWQSCGESEQD